jgi:hypothetical protein
MPIIYPSTKPAFVELPVLELPLYPEGSQDKDAAAFRVLERPTDTINRRLVELGISRQQMIDTLGSSRSNLREDVINAILDEQIYPTYEQLATLLDYVGMQLVAVADNIRNRGTQNHWFHGERCQYCGVNVYDADMYAPGLCEFNPRTNDLSNTDETAVEDV